VARASVLAWHDPDREYRGVQGAREPEVFRGAVLRDRWKILEGTGKGVRHVKFRSTEDVDEGKIRELIDQALEQATATR
jgi:Domain of unknown function (DU1801)